MFVHPHIRVEEDLALIRMHQHTDKQILEEKKRVQGLSKRDFPEFPANKDLTPEEYIEYRQYFFMIACLMGVSDILDPNYEPPHRRYNLPTPGKNKELNHWARRIQHGMAELHQLTVNFMASVVVWSLRNNKTARQFISFPNVDPIKKILSS